MKKVLKIILKVILIVILVVIAAAAGLVIWLSAAEFKPEAVEAAEISGSSSESLNAGDSIGLISWNIGYAGLGENADFFMDGGSNVKSSDKVRVDFNLENINTFIESKAPDIVLYQEVDINSARTYSTDQTVKLAKGFTSHALNYSCPFVPFPWPPIGKVNSGVFTCTDFEPEKAERIALPCPFTWPVSTANLKRCLLVNYIPVEGSDNYLVLINLHLEAYDDGEGKAAQTKMLRDFIEEEYQKGNYVIAGGDFNQTFPGSMEKYPVLKDEFWKPGLLDDSILPDGFRFVYDINEPSCRLLNKPYDVTDTENTQHYILDGFIISPNVSLNLAQNVNLGFRFSDHNPVYINVTLEK